MNILFFNTYIGAAVEAYNRSHIGLSGLYRIAIKAVLDFDEISDWASAQDREKARLQLNKDLVMANAILDKHRIVNMDGSSSVNPVTLAAKPQSFPLSSIVSTKFGKGTILAYRQIEGIYVVEFVDWKIGNDQYARGYLDESAISIYVDKEVSETMFAYMRNRFSSKSIDTSMIPPKVGDQLTTRFGPVIIEQVRSIDNVYEMRITGPGYAKDTMLYGHVEKLNMNAEALKSPIFASIRDATRSRGLSFFGGTLSYIKESFVRSPRNRSKSVEQKFPVGAQVSTPFGNGIVVSYRTKGSIYYVQLKYMNCYSYVNQRDLTWAIRGIIGQPVLTKYGTGLLNDVRQTDGVHVVQLLQIVGGSNAVLHASAIVCSLKAAVGMSVETKYGIGIVLNYRSTDSKFVVALTWKMAHQSAAILYVDANGFTRVDSDADKGSGCNVM